MNILVTGAAGHIGSVTCRYLHSQGHQVRATDMRLAKDSPVPIQVADLTIGEACYPLVQGMDALVHLGNIPNGWGRDPQKLLHDNVTNNMNIFQAATEAGVTKIVFASTVQVISGRRRLRRDQEPVPSSLTYLPLDGDTPPNPGNAYGLSKQLTEEMLRYFCRWNTLSAVAVRLPWVGEQSWINHVHDEDDHWGFNADEAFSYLEINDAARLFEAILKADLPGFRIYFASGKDNQRHKPAKDLADKYLAGVPRRKDLADAKSLIDISRITAETGWEPMH